MVVGGGGGGGIRRMGGTNPGVGRSQTISLPGGLHIPLQGGGGMHSWVGHSKQKVSNSAKSLLCYLQYDASILSIPIYEWFRVSTEYTQHQGVRNLNLIQGVFRKYSRKGGS